MSSSGLIPFSQWMEQALFDPQRGYYSRRVGAIGRRGDFSTSASVDSSLGEAIAAWLKTELKRDQTVPTVIEIGGGDGSLAKAVLSKLGWWQRRSIRFVMVERSLVLREKQETKLSGFGVQWFAELPEALQICEGKALIYHNELLDAFPVRLVKWTDQAWSEVFLDETQRETLLPLEVGDQSHFSALKPWKNAQRCELGQAVWDWMQDWAPHWKSGAMLTLDYGDILPQLYHRKPTGTLRAYLMHQVLTGRDVYQNMGRQDITADVNFTDLILWGLSLGWTSEELLTQREFLQKYLSDLGRRVARSAAAAFIANPEGAGEAFKALVQRPRG